MAQSTGAGAATAADADGVSVDLKAASDRKAAEVVAAAQSLSTLLGTPTTDKTTGSSAVGLIRQSQQGFASLQPDTKADRSASSQGTGAASSGGAQASAVKSGSNDPVIQANIDRVVAKYLDGSSTARAA